MFPSEGRLSAADGGPSPPPWFPFTLRRAWEPPLRVDGRRPAAEENERFVRFGADLRCVGQEVQAGVSSEFHHLEAEGEIADDRVVERLVPV